MAMTVPGDLVGARITIIRTQNVIQRKATPWEVGVRGSMGRASHSFSVLCAQRLCRPAGRARWGRDDALRTRARPSRTVGWTWTTPRVLGVMDLGPFCSERDLFGRRCPMALVFPTFPSSTVCRGWDFQ